MWPIWADMYNYRGMVEIWATTVLKKKNVLSWMVDCRTCTKYWLFLVPIACRKLKCVHSIVHIPWCGTHVYRSKKNCVCVCVCVCVWYFMYMYVKDICYCMSWKAVCVCVCVCVCVHVLFQVWRAGEDKRLALFRKECLPKLNHILILHSLSEIDTREKEKLPVFLYL